MSLEAPLARAKGLGSAKEGIAHWWMQRVTSILLVPLIVWGAFMVAVVGNLDHANLLAAIANPLNAIVIITLLIIVCYHAALGLQVVIEDYVHLRYLKMTAIVLTYFVSFMLALIGIASVIKIAL